MATNDVGELLLGLKLDKILLRKDLANAQICLSNFSVEVSQNMATLGNNITQSLLTPFVQLDQTINQIKENVFEAGKAITESGLVGQIGADQSQLKKQDPTSNLISDGGKIAGDLKNILELSDGLLDFGKKFPELSKVLGPGVSKLITTFASLAKPLLSISKIVIPALLKGLGSIGSFILGPLGVIAIVALSTAWDVWGEDLIKIWEKVKKFFSETFDSIAKKIKTFTDYLTNSAKYFKNLAQDVFGDFFGSSDSKKTVKITPSVSQPPALATGLSIVPQDMLAFLHKGETVLNRSESALAGAGLGGLQIQGDVVVNVPPGMSNPREMAKTMLKEMNTILKRQSGKGIGL